MLRRIRTSRLTMPWWVPATGWAAAGTLAIAGSEYAEDDRVIVAFAGLGTIVLLRRIARQVSAHQKRHRRTDRQLGVAVAVTRAVYECEGKPVPPGLEDEREQRPGADVVRLTPRGAGPRHSRSRRQGA